ncbi:MAG: hypothetical protein SGPRY_002679, partial [Prymnesium sp.]
MDWRSPSNGELTDDTLTSDPQEAALLSLTISCTTPLASFDSPEEEGEEQTDESSQSLLAYFGASCVTVLGTLCAEPLVVRP